MSEVSEPSNAELEKRFAAEIALPIPQDIISVDAIIRAGELATRPYSLSRRANPYKHGLLPVRLKDADTSADSPVVQLTRNDTLYLGFSPELARFADIAEHSTWSHSAVISSSNITARERFVGFYRDFAHVYKPAFAGFGGGALANFAITQSLQNFAPQIFIPVSLAVGASTYWATERDNDKKLKAIEQGYESFLDEFARHPDTLAVPDSAANFKGLSEGEIQEFADALIGRKVELTDSWLKDVLETNIPLWKKRKGAVNPEEYTMKVRMGKYVVRCLQYDPAPGEIWQNMVPVVREAARDYPDQDSKMTAMRSLIKFFAFRKIENGRKEWGRVLPYYFNSESHEPDSQQVSVVHQITEAIPIIARQADWQAGFVYDEIKDVARSFIDKIAPAREEQNLGVHMEKMYAEMRKRVPAVVLSKLPNTWSEFYGANKSAIEEPSAVNGEGIPTTPTSWPMFFQH